MALPRLKVFEKKTPPPHGGNLPTTEETVERSSLPVDDRRMAEWTKALRSYKNSRSLIEQKIKNNEKFWRMRQWKDGQNNGLVPSTAWLFTCIQSKLADIMDSYPTANFRPRQKDDVDEAKRLSSIVPVVVAQNNFEETYKNVSEYTLKNGVGVYHAYWNGQKHNGLGDIEITEMNVLNVFWEAGITDIQKSKYVFVVEVVDLDLLREKYPDKARGIKGKVIEPEKFITQENVDTHNKAVVVDVYYKKNGLLHYAKYSDNVLFESTENNPEMYPNGLYQHGKYPFVVQNLYHVEGSLFGTGMVDIGADAQMQIDLMNEAVVENTLMGSRPRYLSQIDGNIKDEDLLDWRKSVVKCNSISETNTKQIDSRPLQGNYLEFINMKIEELKYVTSNQDANNGIAPSGITAASALAALQETAGKSSRAINRTFHHKYRELMALVVELIREFYDTERWFRIVPDDTANGEEQFVAYDNRHLKGMPQPMVNGMDMGLRIPEFDIDISTEKANPYKKMEMNELALSFYQMGFFDPMRAEQAISCLTMMDFNEKDAIIEKIQQNAVMMQQLQMYQQMAMALAQKYGDARAMSAIQQNMVSAGASPVVGGAINPQEVADASSKTGEAKHVEKARAQARNSTEVD